MRTKDKPQKKKKGRSVQELLGIKTFTKYGLAAGKYTFGENSTICFDENMYLGVTILEKN